MALIPPDSVTKIWSSISEHLEAASKTVRQRHDIADIFEECLTGKQLLWVIFDDDDENKIVGVVTTSVNIYPVFTSLTVPYVGGVNVKEWSDIVVETLSRFARDNGFTSIELYGREAWGRIGEKYGFTKAFSTFELDLRDKTAMAAE